MANCQSHVYYVTHTLSNLKGTISSVTSALHSITAAHPAVTANNSRPPDVPVALAVVVGPIVVPMPAWVSKIQ